MCRGFFCKNAAALLLLLLASRRLKASAAGPRPSSPCSSCSLQKLRLCRGLTKGQSASLAKGGGDGQPLLSGGRASPGAAMPPRIKRQRRKTRAAPGLFLGMMLIRLPPGWPRGPGAAAPPPLCGPGFCTHGGSCRGPGCGRSHPPCRQTPAGHSAAG